MDLVEELSVILISTEEVEGHNLSVRLRDNRRVLLKYELVDLPIESRVGLSITDTPPCFVGNIRVVKA